MPAGSLNPKMRESAAQRSGSGEDLADHLGSRVEPLHLRQRLAIEEEGEAPVFGQGLTSFHIENWVSFRGFVRAVLRYSMLYPRGRRNALKIRSVEYDLRLRRLPRAFEGFRILQISDLHLGRQRGFPPRPERACPRH